MPKQSLGLSPPRSCRSPVLDLQTGGYGMSARPCHLVKHILTTLTYINYSRAFPNSAVSVGFLGIIHLTDKMLLVVFFATLSWNPFGSKPSDAGNGFESTGTQAEVSGAQWLEAHINHERHIHSLLFGKRFYHRKYINLWCNWLGQDLNKSSRNSALTLSFFFFLVSWLEKTSLTTSFQSIKLLFWWTCWCLHCFV